MVTSGFCQSYELSNHFSAQELKQMRIKSRSVYAYDYQGDNPTQTARKMLTETYNNLGQLTERTYEQTQPAPSLKALKLSYTPEGCLSRRMEVSFSDSVVGRTVYSCDSLTRIQEAIRYLPSGEIENKTIFRYEGDELKYKFLLGPQEDTLYSYRYEKEESGDGHVYRSIHPGDFKLFGVKSKDKETGNEQRVNSNEDGAILLRETWQYDNQGQLVIYEQFDAQRNSKWSWRLQYNLKGLPELAQFLKNDRPVWVERYLYDFY